MNQPLIFLVPLIPPLPFGYAHGKPIPIRLRSRQAHSLPNTFGDKKGFTDGTQC